MVFRTTENLNNIEEFYTGIEFSKMFNYLIAAPFLTENERETLEDLKDRSKIFIKVLISEVSKAKDIIASLSSVTKFGEIKSRAYAKTIEFHCAKKEGVACKDIWVIKDIRGKRTLINRFKRLSNKDKDYLRLLREEDFKHNHNYYEVTKFFAYATAAGYISEYRLLILTSPLTAVATVAAAAIETIPFVLSRKLSNTIKRALKGKNKKVIDKNFDKIADLLEWCEFREPQT